MCTRSSILFLLLITIPFVSKGQSGSPVPPPNGDFHQEYSRKMAYFDSLRNEIPDSLFFHEGGEYAQFQKRVRFWESRIMGHGDYEKYYEGVKDFYEEHSVSDRSANTDPWEEIGPNSSVMGGGTSDCGVGPTFFLERSPTDPDHLLTVAKYGGLFYSTDGGDEWHNAGTDTEWFRSSCQHAVFHPTDENTWFAIDNMDHGKIHFDDLPTYGGDRRRIGVPIIGFLGGVQRRDGNTGNWEYIGDFGDFGFQRNLAIKQLKFLPTQNNNNDYPLFAATNNGLWRCDDPNGSDPTWDRVNIGIPGSVDDNYQTYTFDTEKTVIWDIEVRPVTDPDRMYLTASFYGENGSSTTERWRVMVSHDGGQNWEELDDQDAGYPDDTHFLSIEVSKAEPDHVYTLIQPERGKWGVGDGSIEFYDFSPPSSSLSGWNLITNYQYINDAYGRGEGFAIDQVGAEHLMVQSGVTESRCAGYGTTVMGFDISGFNNGSYPSPIDPPNLSTPIPATTTHPDIRDIDFHPDVQDEVWVCNDGGIAYASSPGGTWEARDEGLGIAHTNSMATSYSSPDHILIGVWHNGSNLTQTPYSSSAWDPSWEIVNSGDGIRALIHKKDPDHMYASSPFGNWKSSTDATTNNPSFTNIPPGYGSSHWWSEGDLNDNHIGHLYRAGKDGGNHEVIRSFDNGNSNEVISDFANETSYGVSMIQFIKSNPYKEGELYVAFRTTGWEYKLFRTKKADDPDPSVAQDSWEELPVPRDEYHAWIAGIDFDPEDPDKVYLAYGATYSENNPCSHHEALVVKMDYSDPSAFNIGPCGVDCDNNPCEDLTMNLPETFSNQDALVYEKGSDGGVYFATDFGVYYTNNKRIDAYSSSSNVDPTDFNNQSGWVLLGTGLPHVNPRELAINYGTNRLRIGLYGRGVWEHPLQCPDDKDLTESGVYTSDRFLEAENIITSTAEVQSSRKIRYRAGDQVHLTPGFKAEAGSDFRVFIHPCDQGGNSFKRRGPTGLSSKGSKMPLSSKDEQKDTLDGARRYRVHPNPTGGEFVLLVEGGEGIPEGTIRVHDLSGRSVLKRSLRGRRTAIDLKGSDPGMYFLEVEEGEGPHITRIIKK